jgi:hypothetical protein
MAKRKRDSHGRFIPSQSEEFQQESLPTLGELNIQVQLLSPGFYPDRTVETERGITPNERLQKARELAMLYQKIGQPVPAALGILL